MPGWERVRVHVDSGATDTIGPKEIARAFEMKETQMSRKGIGYFGEEDRGLHGRRTTERV